MVKNLPAKAGDARDSGSIPRLGRSPGEGSGNSLQYCCLENPIDRGAWWATTVHGVTRPHTTEHAHRHTWTHTHTHTHILYAFHVNCRVFFFSLRIASWPKNNHDTFEINWVI